MKKALKKVQNMNALKKLEVESTLSVKEKDQEKSSRRHFLKKSVYSAPVLMTLGQLLKPTDVQADVSVPEAPPAVW